MRFVPQDSNSVLVNTHFSLQRYSKMLRSTAIFVFSLTGLLILLASAAAFDQQGSKAKHLRLVTWFGPGAIELPAGGDWKPELLTVYDNGRRPVAQFANETNSQTASFILFENLSGEPSSKGCREDVISSIIQQDSKLISKRVDGEVKNAEGEVFSTTSYLVDMKVAAGSQQYNLFGFAGNATTCAEIHISKTGQASAKEELEKSLLAEFHPDLDFRPGAADYFMIASVLFKGSPGLAAPYYNSALETMPQGDSYLKSRRVITDQLVMSLGLSGKMHESRAIAEKAITADPEYPLNYYNLACLDAEQGKTADARTHLKQAFDRRSNVIQGESMPDPAKDSSILKLKKDRAFWDFVMSLQK
jgi:tetratricopeptide (TPR) repeat protein